MIELLRILAEGQVRFVLVGGLAVALHGYQRSTLDVDVVLAMDEENLRRFVQVAEAAGLRPTMPVRLDALLQPDLIEQWYREEGQAGKSRSGCSQKGMLAFSVRMPDTVATVLDILVRPVVPVAELLRDAQKVKVGTIEIPVASIDHLIAMKSGTERSKDKIDIEELRKIQAKQ